MAEQEPVIPAQNEIGAVLNPAVVQPVEPPNAEGVVAEVSYLQSFR